MFEILDSAVVKFTVGFRSLATIHWFISAGLFFIIGNEFTVGVIALEGLSVQVFPVLLWRTLYL